MTWRPYKTIIYIDICLSGRPSFRPSVCFPACLSTCMYVVRRNIFGLRLHKTYQVDLKFGLNVRKEIVRTYKKFAFNIRLTCTIYVT